MSFYKGLKLFMNDQQVDKFNHIPTSAWLLSGLLTTPLRWVTGWLFFSAFWRRVVLAPAKLDPDAAGYVGFKFNHFLPNAILIKPMLVYLLSNPDLLYIFLIVFTIIECLVGLALIFGFLTRLASLGVALLSWGILMGAGWIGTTCLDEWQIGAFGISTGLLLVLTGAGPWSLDNWWQKKWPSITDKAYMRWLSSGPLRLKKGFSHAAVLTAIIAILSVGFTLYTNQAFFGGIWGKLHNPSKQPHMVLSEPLLSRNGTLDISIFQDGGPDTYGGFVIKVSIKDKNDKIIEVFDVNDLASIPPNAIVSKYIAKAHSGKYSLVVPVGSDSRIHLEPKKRTQLPPGDYIIQFDDVSGLNWSTPVTVK